MVRKSRHIFIASCIVFTLAACFALTIPVFADQCSGAQTNIINCEEGGDGGIFHIIKLLLNILTAGIGILAVVGVIISGAMILTARDNEAQVSKAKKRIIEIIIGVICWALFWAVMNLLLPNGSLNSGAEGITSISISVTSPVEVDNYVKPVVTVTPDTARDKTYALESSDPNIVAVQGGTTAKCLKVGSATITATSANGKKGSTTVTCKEKPAENPVASGGGNNSGNSGGNTGSSGPSYSPSQINDVVSLFNSMSTPSYTELKNLAKSRYGISEDNFIGIVAWSRTENYENHNTGDPSGIYMAYLCSSVAINKAMQYEKQGNGSGWLNEMLGYPPQSVYADSRYYGTSGYYDSNLKIVKIALDHLYANVENCNGVTRPASPVYTWTSVYGEKSYVW